MPACSVCGQSDLPRSEFDAKQLKKQGAKSTTLTCIRCGQSSEPTATQHSAQPTQILHAGAASSSAANDSEDEVQSAVSRVIEASKAWVHARGEAQLKAFRQKEIVLAMRCDAHGQSNAYSLPDTDMEVAVLADARSYPRAEERQTARYKRINSALARSSEKALETAASGGDGGRASRRVRSA